MAEPAAEPPRRVLALGAAAVVLVGLAGGAVLLARPAAHPPAAVAPHTTAPLETPQPLADYPDASTAGWRHTGVSLTPSPGLTVTEDGAVVDALDIAGNLDIKADNVTVQRSRITAGNVYPVRVYPGYHGFRLVDSEVAGVNSGPSQCAVGVTGSVLLVQRVDIHDCADGIHPGSDVTITDTYIHDLWLGTDASGVRVVATHNDGIQLLSGTHFVIEHNRIEVGHHQNAAVFVKSDFGPISDVRIARNYLDGGSYTVFGEETAKGTVTDVTITGNMFGRSSLYGPLFTEKWTGPVVVTGNTDDRGAPVGGTVSAATTRRSPP